MTDLTATTDQILADLEAMGFRASVSLAHSWAFFVEDAAPASEREMMGLAAEAAWETGHPQEVVGTLDVIDGYRIEFYAYVADGVTAEFVGIRPDGTEVILTEDDVRGIVARFAVAA